MPREPTDDALMDRFDRNARRFRARDAVLTVAIAMLVLVLFKGTGMQDAGERLKPGVERDVVVAAGEPAGWLSDQLPLRLVADELDDELSPDAELSEEGGFTNAATETSDEVPPVTPDAFPAAALGAKPAPPRELKTVLVTGDSLSQPLDLEVARRLAGSGARVQRDARLGTGISKTALLDWGKFAVTQARQEKPDAVVMFIGANEGFPIPNASGQPLECCDARWAAAYANRARRMMDTYRRDGAARVYWITVPTPRDPERQKIARTVNAAITVAAQPYRAQVRVIDSVPIFTPGAKYRDALPVGGRSTLVRESDGIHLNDAGARVLADTLLEQMGTDFSLSGR